MISLAYLLKLFGAFGFVSGVFSSLWYASANYAEGGLWKALFFFFLSPVVQPIFSMLFCLFCYPFYMLLVRRGWLTFDPERDLARHAKMNEGP